MAKKPIKLGCFEIVPIDQKLTRTPNFFDNIKDAFSTLGNINDRCRKLSDLTVEGEQEFVSKVSVSKNGLFCTFLHLKEGGSINIQKSLLDSESFSLEDLVTNTDGEIAGHLKDYTYFLLTKKLLILRLTRGISASEISIYLNWILKETIPAYADKNSVLQLRQCLRNAFNPLNVGSIVVGGDVRIEGRKSVDTIIQPLFKDWLDKLIKSKGIRELDPDSIIRHASLILTIERKSDKNPKDRARILQSLLDACNSDSTEIRDKKNAKIDPASIKEDKEVRIQFNDSGFPDVAVLEEEMWQYYNEVIKT
jgi:hypothetical protein